MKRIEGFKLLPLLLVLLLTGCTDKLKCEIDTNNYVAKLAITFVEDKPTKYNFKDKMFFSTKTTDSEVYYHSKYFEYGTLLSEKRARMRNAPDFVSLRIRYDFTKHNSSQENKLLISRDDSKERSISKLENLGYKCK